MKHRGEGRMGVTSVGEGRRWGWGTEQGRGQGRGTKIGSRGIGEDGLEIGGGDRTWGGERRGGWVRG